MTAEANFEKWWEHKDDTVFVDCFFENNNVGAGFSLGKVEDAKEIARRAYLAATKATAARCAEICQDKRLLGVTGESHGAGQRCAVAIKKEFDL